MSPLAGADRLRAAHCPRVLIADNEAPTRAGLRQILEGDGLAVCAEARDAETAVQAAIALIPDIAVISFDMPDGLAATSEIARGVPNVRIIVLANEPKGDDMLQSLRVGAFGYLSKETRLERLPHALRGALAGEAALPRALVGRLVEEYYGRSHRRLSVPGRPDVRLTRREWEVLELMREHFDTSGMAQRLGICPVTVRRHVASLMHKLDAPDRARAVALVAGAGDQRLRAKPPLAASH